MRCEFGGGTGPGTEARIIGLKIRRFALNNLPMTKGMKMKRPMAVFLAIVALAGPVRAEDKAELKDNRTKFSYAIGLNMGSQLKRQKIDPDINLILKGIKDGIGGHPQFTDQEVREVFTTFQQEHQKQMAEQNKQEGDKFLAENKSREGVKALEVTLPDGKKSELQYKVLAEGKGDSPKSNDVVTVNYRGTLIDGTEFDSSYKRNQPYTTPAIPTHPSTWPVRATSSTSTGARTGCSGPAIAWRFRRPPSRTDTCTRCAGRPTPGSIAGSR